MGRFATKTLMAKQFKHESTLGFNADRSNPDLYLHVIPCNLGVTRFWVNRYASTTNRSRRKFGIGPAKLIKLADPCLLGGEPRLKVLYGA